MKTPGVLRFLLCILAFAVVTQTFAHPVASWRVISITDKEFLAELQRAVMNKDRAWVASHTSYPIHARVDGQLRAIGDQKSFITNYDEIIDAKVIDAVEDQKPDKLFKNIKGIMVGAGEIWFLAVIPDVRQSEKVDYYIIGINN